MTTELFRTYDASSVTITDSETTIYEEGGLSVLSTVKIYLKNTGSKALADFSIYGKTPDGNYEDITPAGKWYTNYNTAQTLAGSDTELTVTFDFTSYNKLKITGTCGASDTTTIEYEIHGTNINTNISEQQVFNTTSNRQEVEVYTTDDKPIATYVVNEKTGEMYSTAENDFTATIGDGTTEITLSVDTLGGMALTEQHFNDATLSVYQASTEKTIEIILDDYTWTSGTKVLDIANCTNAITFATGDEVTLTIPAPPKAYDKTNNANIIEGNQVEGATPIDQHVSVGGGDVADTAFNPITVDDPATIAIDTPAQAVYDKNADIELIEIDANIGDVTDAVVEGDVAGTLSAKLRGIQKILGTITDAAIVAGADGTLSAKIKLVTSQLDSIKTAIEIIDDWDESDRAKVNLISGQVGVDGNSGAKSDKTIRTVSSTDDPSLGPVGDAEDADGSFHAQILYLNNRLDAIEDFLTNWENSGADGASVTGDVDHDTADAGEPVKIGLKAVNAQPTAVDAGDRVNAIGNLFGELILAGYDYATEKIGISESDPLDEHYVAEELIDDTNLAADTYYYPSSDGFELGNFKDISVQFGLSGGVTFTVEAKIDNSTDWLDITKAGCELNTDTSGNASFVDTDGILQFENLNVRNVRYKIVTSDTTNALQLHHRKKSL